jgi:ABC-2 type transport system permease protein
MSMRHVNILLRRELGAYFLTPMAYLVLLAFQLVAFWNFWILVDTLSQPQRAFLEFSSLNDPMTGYVSESLAFWGAVLVAVPVLTMRLLAEERRSGTIETLLTLPVTEAQVVVAKWLAGVVMYLALLLPFILYLPFLYYQARFHFDVGPLAALAAGLTTMGMMFVALGLLMSALTRNQIVAAIWTFVAMLMMIVVVPLLMLAATRRQGGWLEAAQFTSIYHQIRGLALGRLDLRHLAFHLSVCVLLLSLTVRVVAARGNR